MYAPGRLYLSGEDIPGDIEAAVRYLSLPADLGNPFALPEANENMRRVFAYLIKTRLLDREVVTHFAKAKMLYEDAACHNAVFVGFDKDGTARHAHKRSTIIKCHILNGSYQPGQKLPSIRAIAEKDGHNPATVCHALAILR